MLRSVSGTGGMLCRTAYGGGGSPLHPGEPLRDRFIQRRASIGTGVAKVSYDGEWKELAVVSREGGLKGNKVNTFRAPNFD